MADYSGLDEAALNEKMKEASSYDERAAIRKAIRQLKKEQGRPVGRATRREATYNRFAGRNTAATATATPRSYIVSKETSSPARGPTPTKTPPIRSPVPFSPPPSQTPPPHVPSPLEASRELPVSASSEEPDGIPPYTEEPSPPVSPVVPSPSPPRPRSPSPIPHSPSPIPRSPSPVPRSPTPTTSEKDVLDSENVEDTNERVEPEEEAEPDREFGEPDEKEVEPQEEAEPDKDEVEPEEEEVELAAEPEDDGVEPDTGGAEPEEQSEEPPVMEEKPRPLVAEKTSVDDADGSPFGKKLCSRRPETTPTSPREKEGGTKAEFQGFKLRKTLSHEQQPGRTPRGSGGGGGGLDFGVKLRSRPSPSTTDVLPTETSTVPLRSRAKTFGGARQTATASSSSSTSSRTLRDYQQLSAHSQRSKIKSSDKENEGGTTLPVEELQRYLVVYVNKELSLSPAIPSQGKALYDVCSDPNNLCKLINKSVRNTVDLRALTTITSSMPASEREEAVQENMTLTTESARAIGCQVTDSTGDLIIRRDPPTIRSFLIDLIRARVVHMPGMDDEPTSTFTNLSVLFSKLGISEGVDGEGEGGGESGEVEDRGEIKDSDYQALKTPPKSPPSARSWRDAEKPQSPTTRTTAAASSSFGGVALTYEERAAMRRAKREQERWGKGAGLEEDTSSLTYEERAAMRRGERERRRQERAELAGSQ